MKPSVIKIAALLAGIVTGIFGAGGGMILVPLLRRSGLSEKQIFPASVAIILPICFASLISSSITTPLPWLDAFPYLIGSTGAGILVGFCGHRFPLQWLHRLLGLCLIWGGIRYLW